MIVLYSLSTRFYAFAILLASFFNEKAKEWIIGRQKWKAKLPPSNGKEVYWFHCASLGEFDQGLPLMNQLKERNPELFLLVTFFSPSGMQHYQKRNAAIDHAMYLPIDSSKNARALLQHFKPKKIFFVKYEFWHHYIAEAKKEGIPVYSISTLLRDNQIYFKWYGGFFRKILKSIEFFFVQNEKTADLLSSIGISNYSIVGDTRFDRVIENSIQAKKNEVIEQFLKDEKAVIFGSTWPTDEAIFIPSILLNNQDKFIIAPHDISVGHIKQLESQLGQKAIRYSNYSAAFQGNILILDTIGHLASAYKYGKTAYVGGGFSGKLHNILEPAVFGLPVLFGPKFDRFPEASMFIEKGIGFSISDCDTFVKQLTTIEKNLPNLQEKAKAVVNENRGASLLIINQLAKLEKN